MDDSTLLTIAIATTILGLMALCILVYTAVIPETSIAAINDSTVGKKIVVTGAIMEVQQRNSTTFLKIIQTCSLDVIVFKPINMTTGTARIEGIIQEYEGKKELIADRITLK